MSKRAFVPLTIVFIACVAIGFYLPSSVALPLAGVIFVVSTIIARTQKQTKKPPQKKPESDEL